jgi:hypothetical protein
MPRIMSRYEAERRAFERRLVRELERTPEDYYGPDAPATPEEARAMGQQPPAYPRSRHRKTEPWWQRWRQPGG